MGAAEHRLRELAERSVLATALCRALVDGSRAEIEASYRLYRGWMRSHELWEDTDRPKATHDEEWNSIAQRVRHAEIVVGYYDLTLGSELSEAAEDHARLHGAVAAWRRKTGYAPASNNYPPADEAGT